MDIIQTRLNSSFVSIKILFSVSFIVLAIVAAMPEKTSRNSQEILVHC